MILDFEYSKGKLLVSEVDEKGDIKMNYYPWRNPKKYEICDTSDPEKHPKYHTWDKKPVKIVNTNSPNKFSTYEYIDRLPREEKDRLFKYNTPKIFFIDIETQILDTGFVEPIDAKSMVQTVAIVKDRQVMVLGIKPLTTHNISDIRKQIETHFEKFNLKVDFKYISFHDRDYPELDMLMFLFEKLIPKMTVITGWNFIDYDWTFLINRCRRLSIDPSLSSYTGRLQKIFGTHYEVPAHRMIVDYMEIYKKWDTSIKVKENNSLDWVSSKILELDTAKVHYNGSLQDMYNNDFVKYVFYNAVDTILVQLIHEKQRYIDIAYSIANLAKIRLCDFAYKNLNTTLVQTEGFLRERFRNEWDIVFCQDEEIDDAEKISGGWVKPPNKGMNEWVACFDFASLYPTTQRQFNIAPEVFKGFVMKNNPGYADFDGRINKINSDDIICNNGAVFERKKAATIQFLEEVYGERKRYKNMMNEQKKIADDLKHEIHKIEEELKNNRNS